MRAILLVLAAASLGANPAHADEGALAPGKPAGVRAAQMWRDPYVYVAFGAGLIGAGIAIAESSNLTVVTTSTATTATSP